MVEISIIVRTHNEEKWIGQCLREVKSQTFEDFEIVLVDNQSTDKTVEKAQAIHPELTLVTVDDYLPGFALNEGIRASDGNYFVCLSAHCVPVDDTWLESLRENFDMEDDVAGVYGRQVPVKFSDPVDKRDLIRTFGLERRVQTKDTFFHNANSMVSRSVWEAFPFDEEVTNIEDQIWANEVTNAGYKLVYEPEAAVYHHHGINKGNDDERTRNVVRTMENEAIQDDDIDDQLNSNPLDPTELDVVSFIPLRQKNTSGVDSNEELIRQTIEAVTESEYIDDLIVSADTDFLLDKSLEWGADDTVRRPEKLSEPDIHVVDVHRYTLEQVESGGRYPDLVVPIEITLPFRPPNILDELVDRLVHNGHDSVVTTWPEYRPSWKETDGKPRRLNEDDVRQERDAIQVGLPSLGCVTRPEILRSGNRIGDDVGFYEITNPFATIEIRKREDLKYWEKLMELGDIMEE
jgi:glycosyltransferase involved in cell wall biosynthesis